eukprot:maker-scaffold3_size1495701-snap-gene-4.4 protein:Tk07945 transcript:maker-scaffold3_size1495701-snap-gene-4.4-mRNA-1 annotation:"holliday junction resolvase"
MTRDTVERAVKRGTGELEGVDYEEIRYEGYAPAGVAILVDCTTDNKNRTVGEVRHAFSKYGGNLGTDGSVSYLFSKVGWMYFNEKTDEDQLMELAIDAGAEDVVVNDDKSIEVMTLNDIEQQGDSIMRVLGVDPGSRITGYGIVEAQGQNFKMIEGGYIRLPNKDLPHRLGEIYTKLQEVIREHDPDVFAIEQVFFAKNPKAALTLGQARGAAICAAVVSHLPVYEYSAKQIKQAVVGHGGAAKAQVQYMIRLLLKMQEMPQEDMADGLACSICHIQNSR